MNFKGVIFDLFGTLVPYVGKDEFSASLIPIAQLLEVELETIENIWSTEAGFYKAITVYSSTYERIFDLCRVLGIDNETKIIEAIRSRLLAHKKWLIPKKTTIETLKRVKDKNLKVGLVSDCSAEVFELWESTVISKYIDVPLFSCIEKMNKSGLAIFKLCYNRMELAPEEIVYVGDALSELKFAQELGMVPVLIKTRKQVHWTGDTISEPTEVLKFLL